MFQNIGGLGNASDQPSQYKLDAFKEVIINEIIATIVYAKEHIYNRTVGWLKKGGLAQDITKLLLLIHHYKVESQPSCR